VSPGRSLLCRASNNPLFSSCFLRMDRVKSAFPKLSATVGIVSGLFVDCQHTRNLVPLRTLKSLVFIR
jgi:hypothetical protein